MSVENDPVQRTASPLSSGRSSPIHSKARQKDEDTLLKRDKGYRRYASTVERVLAQFDTAVEEWADYISFLGRLLKAISIKPSGFAEIPHKTQVAKRLSQCLNPKLPSGVHQKTLEVYAYVFSTLGRDGLAADLGLYLPGLTPILSFAALSVKPNVLAIFEAHIVPLRPAALRPALKSILLALLPGLEEENSEEFDRTLRIVNALKVSVAYHDKKGLDGEESSPDQHFWQCMFLACITSSTRRPGGLAYLIRYLPNLGNPPSANGTGVLVDGDSSNPKYEAPLQKAIDTVVSPDAGLLVCCFCAGLQDQQPLTQRGFLDLLVTHIPLNSVVLQEKVGPADLQKLVLAATSVVARKDMSLNRRLWSWFLGPEHPSEVNGTVAASSSPRSASESTGTEKVVVQHTPYFEKYGLAPLVEGILSMIAKASANPVERTRPLRISLSLMDRWEIGCSVVPRVFLPSMRSVWGYQGMNTSNEAQAEVIRSAKMFFDGVESSLIWSELYEVTSNALRPGNLAPGAAEDTLQMVDFVVANFNIREEEMQMVHMPLILLMIILHLLQLFKQPQALKKSNRTNVLHYTLRIANSLIEYIPERALSAETDTKGSGSPMSSLPPDKDILEFIGEFYTESKGNVDVGKSYTHFQIGQMILENSFTLITVLMIHEVHQSDSELESAVSLLASIIRKGPVIKPGLDQFFATLVGKTEDSGQPQVRSFAVTAAKVSALEAIFLAPHSTSWVSAALSRIVFPALINELWQALSPSRPKHNVEAVRCLWRLYALCDDHQIIDSTIVTLMVQCQPESLTDFIEIENARKFTTLWAHTPSTSASSQGRRSSIVRPRPGVDANAKLAIEISLLERPLLLLLDALSDPSCSLFPFVVNWLQSLALLTPIFNLLICRLSSVRPIIIVSVNEQQVLEGLDLEEDPDGLFMCLYYLQTIYHVIEYSTSNSWPALASNSQAQAVEQESVSSIQDYVVETAIKILKGRRQFAKHNIEAQYQLYQTSLSLLRQFYNGPLVSSMVEKRLEDSLIDELIRSVEAGEHSLQTSLMEVILAALRSRNAKEIPLPSTTRHQHNSSRDISKPIPNLAVAIENSDMKSPTLSRLPPPAKLLESIILGLRTPSSRPVLESWTDFLGHCLPLYEEGIFRILLPLVGCFCKTLESLLDHVKEAYESPQLQVTEVLDPTIALLLNGLEQSLATAHDVLTNSEATTAPIKSPEPQASGFFGNMVSGVFNNEVKSAKTPTANNRLTVLLCFKDAMRICFFLWCWGDTGKDYSFQDNSAMASFNYITLRLRNRTRRIFEHLFAAEALECLETLIELWQKSPLLNPDPSSSLILDLLSALESSRPKIIMPAIFNAIYSRTNPAALEPGRKSSLTSTLGDNVSASFLVAYVRSLDDDAMDEIWTDCITFLKDVLANPMPHRQILPRLIEFTAVLGQKVDNTSFGEQRKMRRELGDLFVRLLTATLTIRPIGAAQEAATSTEQLSSDGSNFKVPAESRYAIGTEGLVSVLAAITPSLSKVLVDSDRIASTANTISTQVLGPTFRSKAFPENVTRRTLELLQALAGISEASKPLKRDVAEAFNDSRFFSTPLTLALNGWLGILRSWSLGDKERMPELLTRLIPPAAAGVLGIGATSARTEADRKAQLNLRRIALLVLAAANDTYVVNLTTLQDKIVDLLNATTTSSPSSMTRAEIYMLIRALVLKISPIHLAPLWPMIGSELFDAISSAYPNSGSEGPNTICLLQACKLLDTLLALEIDDFQMQEWLFISDTADAFYRPPDLSSVALVDDLTEALDEQKSQASGHLPTDTDGETRKPLLTKTVTKDIPKEDLLDKVLRPFFRQLSIHALESTYNMQVPDWQACFDELMADLFDDSTLV